MADWVISLDGNVNYGPNEPPYNRMVLSEIERIICPGPDPLDKWHQDLEQSHRDADKAMEWLARMTADNRPAGSQE